MKTRLILCLFCGLLALSGAQAKPRGPSIDLERELLLFNAEKMLGPVYYPEGAPPSVQEAAEELAGYLELLAGREWPVEPEGSHSGAGLYLGQTLAAKAAGVLPAGPQTLPAGDALGRLQQSQRLHVAVKPDRVYLVGATPEATVMAVYRFLSEEMGLRWFTPGAIGEELPRLTKKSLPLGLHRDEPAFLNRVLLAARGGEDATAWGRHNLLSASTWSFNHSLHRIIPPDLFEEHPEWFSQVGGKRTPTAGGRGPNPHLAHAEVAAFVAGAALGYFEENPTVPTFSISVTDSLHFDQSEETLRIVQPYTFFRHRPNYSDLVFSFSNEVAEDIWPLNDEGQIDFSEVPPVAADKYVAALAYYWAEQVPSFPVHPRVIPYLTSDRGQWFSDAYRAEDKALIKAWVANGPEIVGTWDYYEGGPYFVPRYFTEQVAESIPFLASAGVRAFFAEGSPMWGFDAPRLWLAAQLLWDAQADPETLLDEFFTGYYREAAGPMRQFFQLCQEQWNAQPGPPVWIKYYRMPSQAELFPLPVWDRLEHYLSEAEELAQSTRVKERIALTREDFDFGRAMSRLYFAWKEHFQNPQIDAARLKAARAEVEAMEIPPGLRRGEIKDILLDATEVDLAEPPEAAEWLHYEDFAETWVQGDLLGTGPLPFVSASLANGWKTSSFHNDRFNFRRSTDSVENYGMGARIEGASYFKFARWLPAQADATIDVRLRFRGAVSPGSRIFIVLRWINGEGQLMTQSRHADIPVGTYADWSTLAEQTRSPEDAAWVNVSVTFIEQMPGDWLEIDWVKVTEWSALGEHVE